MSLFSKLILLINLGYLTDILMCFFLGKFISEIYEYSQKSEKFSKSLYAQSASRNPRNLADYFEIEFI